MKGCLERIRRDSGAQRHRVSTDAVAPAVLHGRASHGWYRPGTPSPLTWGLYPNTFAPLDLGVRLTSWDTPDPDGSAGDSERTTLYLSSIRLLVTLTPGLQVASCADSGGELSRTARP